MLGHLIVESRDNENKQEIYESEFNLIVIYLIGREENQKRTNEGKEKDRQSRLTRNISDDFYMTQSFPVGI